MQGEMHQRMMPNCEHSMATCRDAVVEGLTAFVFGIVTQQSRPEFKWKIDDQSGQITVQPLIGNVTAATVWVATTLSTTRRDFRLVALQPDGKPGLQAIPWLPYKLTVQPDGTYVTNIPLPDKGWRGFFVELQYPAPGGEFEPC